MNGNSRKLIFLTLLTMLVVLATPSSVFSQNDDVKVAFDLSHGQGDKLLAQLEGNLTVLGYTSVEITGGITAAKLTGVDVLLLGAVYGTEFTDAEVSAISDWFDEGGKGIWVGSDSDYAAYSYINNNTNKVLEAIGSKLRGEPTSVEDPESNCGAAYRVVANVVSTDPIVSDMTEGVQKALFHGPTVLCGYVGGSYVALETTNVENVIWVMKTSSASIITDADLIPPHAHSTGDQGSFVIMAAERFAGPNGNNKIVAAGASPYGDYQPIFSDAYYGVQLQGPALVAGSIKWLATVERLPTFWEKYMWYIVGGVAVLLVVGVYFLVIKKKK